MEQAQEGFLLIADIIGYTAFLHESELEHAKDSLRSLLEIVGRKMFQSSAEEGLEVLVKIIAEENTGEDLLQSKDMEISGELLERAVAESLAEF